MQTVINMMKSEPPKVTRNATLEPLCEGLAKTVYALKTEVHWVALKHYQEYHQDSRVLAIEVYYFPEEDHIVREGASPDQALKDARRGSPVAYFWVGLVISEDFLRTRTV